MLSKISNYFLDVSKLVIGGVIIGALMQGDFDVTLTALLGAVVAVLTAAAGFLAHYFDNRNKNKKS
jgi:hypothetical protein